MTFKEFIEKVGLKVNTLLTPFTTTAYGEIGSRVFKGRSAKKIDGVVLHTTGNPSATAQNEADNIHNNLPPKGKAGQSFHAVADEHGVFECVRFADTAYHAGDKSVNLRTLGFELSDKDPAKGYDNFIKYVAWAMHQEKIVPSVKTVLFHNEIVPTSCGAFLREKGKEAIIADLNKYIAIAKSSDVKPEPTPEPKPPAKKTNEQIADEVIAGKWGNDPKRSNDLRAAGYDPKVIQGIVNKKLGATTAPKPPAPTAIKKGDKVKVVNAIQYNGGRFAVLRNSYDVIEIKGDRVVIGVGKAVTVAINVVNLKKV